MVKNWEKKSDLVQAFSKEIIGLNQVLYLTTPHIFITVDYGSWFIVHDNLINTSQRPNDWIAIVKLMTWYRLGIDIFLCKTKMIKCVVLNLKYSRSYRGIMKIIIIMKYCFYELV